MKNSLQPKTQTVGKYKLKGTKKDKVGYRVKRNHISIVITRHRANTMDIRSSNIWKEICFTSKDTNCTQRYK